MKSSGPRSVPHFLSLGSPSGACNVCGISVSSLLLRPSIRGHMLLNKWHTLGRQPNNLESGRLEQPDTLKGSCRSREPPRFSSVEWVPISRQYHNTGNTVEKPQAAWHTQKQAAQPTQDRNIGTFYISIQVSKLSLHPHTPIIS